MPRLTLVPPTGKELAESAKFMVADLRRSGLTPEDIPVAPEPITEHGAPAYVIGYGVKEDGSYYRTRIKRNDGDAQPKYISPKGQGQHPWWDTDNHYARWSLSSVKFLVEGEKKAACVAKYMKVPALGLPGCYGYMTGKREEVWTDKAGKQRVRFQPSEPHPGIFDKIRPGDTVVVLMDGDVLTNQDVSAATSRLRALVLDRGATIVLPQLPDKGADDWIMSLKKAVRDDPAQLREAFDALPQVDADQLVELPGDFIRRLALQVKTKVDKMGNSWVEVKNTDENARKLVEELLPGKLKIDSILGSRIGDDRYQDAYHDHDIARAVHLAIDDEFPFLTLKRAIRAGIARNRTNLLGDWLKTLKWDKKRRIHTLFTEIAKGVGPKEYLESAARSLLVGMVARGLVPGTKYDFTVVLIGMQGILKTTFWEVLAGKLYGEPLCRQASISNQKHLERAVDESWLLNFDELSGMERSELAALKQFQSQWENDREVKYVEELKRTPRQCVLAATANEHYFTGDLSGGRRWLPLAIEGEIDIARLRVEREQLFAEAVALYQGGYEFWKVEGAEKRQDDHRRKLIEEEMVAQCIEDKCFLVLKDGRKLVTGAGIAYLVNKDAKQGEVNSITQRVSRVIAIKYRWRKVAVKCGTIDVEATKRAGLSADKWASLDPKKMLRGWLIE